MAAALMAKAETMRELRLNKKYQPLFQPVPGVRYYVVTGGRAPGKSFAVSTAVNYRTYQTGHNILFTRYSMVSADLSIIPEFTEKMELCNNRQDFQTKGAEITNLRTGARIFFKGILQSRKNNDARLKSVQDVELWVLDEAQELADERQFDIIDLSIRAKGAKCEVWLLLNPTDVNHWIYRRFFKEMEVEDGFNGVKGDVCYIHTTYLENRDNLDETFIAQANKMKEKDYEKYRNIFLGFWTRFTDGIIYQNWNKSRDALAQTARPDAWYGVDWGFTNDPTAIVRIWYDTDTAKVYVSEVAYARGLLVGQIANLIREDMQRNGISATFIYCDPARPEHIAELRRVYNLDAVPANNKDKAGRVDWLKGCDVTFWGANIEAERAEYSYMANPKDQSNYTNMPQDGNDHLMDAINYGVVSHLRRQGYPNSLGEA